MGGRGIKQRHRSDEAAQRRILQPYVDGLADEDRAYRAYAAACARHPGRHGASLVARLLLRIWRRSSAWRARWTPWLT